MKYLFCVLPLLLFVSASHAQTTGNRLPIPQPLPEVWLKSGFLSGEMFRNLPEASKRFYVQGLVDGVLSSPLLGAPKSRTLWLETCLEDRTDTQVSAMLVKYLNDNPEYWHMTANMCFYNAMVKACR